LRPDDSGPAGQPRLAHRVGAVEQPVHVGRVPAGKNTERRPPPMSAAAVSLTAIVAIVAVGTAIGVLAGVSRRMDLEQWTAGGRGFGVVLVFLLTAGEVYTTFAFLGA